MFVCVCVCACASVCALMSMCVCVGCVVMGSLAVLTASKLPSIAFVGAILPVFEECCDPVRHSAVCLCGWVGGI